MCLGCAKHPALWLQDWSVCPNQVPGCSSTAWTHFVEISQMEKWEPEVDGQAGKKTLYGSSHKPEQQMGEKVTTENLSLYICTTVNLQIVSFLLGCDCSCAVIERCWKKVSPPPVWGLNHYRGICSSTGNILGVKTGTPWKHGLGLSVKCWGEPVWQAFLCLLVEFGFWQNLM